MLALKEKPKGTPPYIMFFFFLGGGRTPIKDTLSGSMDCGRAAFHHHVVALQNVCHQLAIRQSHAQDVEGEAPQLERSRASSLFPWAWVKTQIVPPSEHPIQFPLRQVIKWVVLPPQNGTIGFEPWPPHPNPRRTGKAQSHSTNHMEIKDRMVDTRRVTRKKGRTRRTKDSKCWSHFEDGRLTPGFSSERKREKDERESEPYDYGSKAPSPPVNIPIPTKIPTKMGGAPTNQNLVDVGRGAKI